jgi:hypothetical protein
MSILAQLIDIQFLEINKGQIDGLPKNPRFVNTDKFEKLVKSIKDDPEMLQLRECLVYPHKNKFVVIAGNMRLQALRELKYKNVFCKILPIETTIEKLKAYTIKDNVSFGSHDFDLLANDWNVDQLIEWGLDIPHFIDANYDEPKEENKDLIIEPNLKIIFKSPDELQKAHNEIQELLDRNYPNAILSINIGDY